MKILWLLIIIFSAISLVFVGRITEIGGSRYAWEYIPPAISLVYGFWQFWRRAK